MKDKYIAQIIQAIIITVITVSVMMIFGCCTVYKVYPVTVQVVRESPIRIGNDPYWSFPVNSPNELRITPNYYTLEVKPPYDTTLHLKKGVWRDYDDVILSIKDPKTP